MSNFICAYGHTTRLAEKAPSAEEAAFFCFGTKYRVTVVDYGKKSWKYLNLKLRNKILEQLRSKHFSETGELLSF